MMSGPVYKREDGSYEIDLDGYRYHATNDTNTTIKMVEGYLAEHPEALVPKPVPPPPSAEEIERQRVAGIMASLSALDARAIRPMRAKLAGSATVQDEETLAEIEEEATALRGEL